MDDCSDAGCALNVKQPPAKAQLNQQFQLNLS